MNADLLHGLVYATLASSAAILAVLALRKPLRARVGARAAYALWAFVPLAAAVCLLPGPTVETSMRLLPLNSAPAALGVAIAPSEMPASIDFEPWLLGAWLLGGVGLLVLQYRQQRRFVRGLGRLSAVDRGVVRAQTTAGCPALIGAWRPRVVLPADFEQRYTRIERELILAHECQHRARGDAQVNALAAALRCVFWFNPLVHFAASRLRMDQELSCDAGVIASFPEARRPYADAMLKTQLADIGLPVGCHWQSSHPLMERITMLKQPLPGPARAALGAAIAFALVVSGTYVAWASQPATVSRIVSSAAGAAEDGAAAKTPPQDRPASYRRMSQLAYPEKTPVAGDCVAIVTLNVDAGGAITDLASLTFKGSAPTCNRWSGQAAAAILAKPWTFEPAYAAGKPVACKVVVPLVFSAHPTDTVDTSSIPSGALDAIRISATPA